MNSREADLILVKRILEGDTQSYNPLVERYQYRLQNVVMSYVRDPNEACDIVQECFIRAFRALPKFKQNASFYTWIYRIAINCARTYAIKEKKHAYHHEVAYETLSIDSDKGSDRRQVFELDNPELMLSSEESLKIISDVIEDMPTDMRTAYTLREIDGLSYMEVAKIMKCPIGTVRSRIYRARTVMESKLKQL